MRLLRGNTQGELRAASVGSQVRKGHTVCARACGGGPDEGLRLPTQTPRRACRRPVQGELRGRGPVRSGGHKLSFVHSSPEVAGTVDSTVCTLRLNKAGKEVGGEGEDAVRKRKLS